jgi:glycine/D-amino acid oxidase-like deaminating enzyme
LRESQHHWPVKTPGFTRREFLSAALVGLARKSGREITGGFVHESQETGHLLRDGGRFAVPREERRVPVVIVGAGIGGLSAAWRLTKRGLDDIVVLELEARGGGNARWGENDVTAFPWAAHYVPVPGQSAGLVRELFTDLGVFDGREWAERHLVHAPKERLFIHGRWQEGLEPAVGPGERDRDQMKRFDERMRAMRDSGRFTLPAALGLASHGAGSEDRVSMAAWLAQAGFDSPWLKWLVDYACRDDYGALSQDVSAWAGLHYFAARSEDEEGPLTWPEGNGWIARRLLERLGSRVHTSSVVYRVERQGTEWRVLTPEIAWRAQAVIVAAPLLVASRVIEGSTPSDVVYSPWVTANLTLDRWPREGSFPPAWDNVIFDSPGLGYVIATHQQLRRFTPQTVWTYYWALAEMSPIAARRWLLKASWTELRDKVLKDLSRAHPDIGECVTRVDIWRIGHAMVRPTPGFLSSPARQPRPAYAKDRLFLAHSDVSGLPLFEEAQYRGVAAADACLEALGRWSRSG